MPYRGRTFFKGEQPGPKAELCLSYCIFLITMVLSDYNLLQRDLTKAVFLPADSM